MHDGPTRHRAAELRAAGHSLAQVAAITGVSQSSVIRWAKDPDALARRRAACPRCGTASLHTRGYSALLGYYLGDGYLARGPRYDALRITCDAAYPGIVTDVSACIGAVRPGGRIALPRRQGCVVVQSQWQHWACLFPQHGPGRKHERAIVLEPWQEAVVEDDPASFLRGLFHSDGSRVDNWARQTVSGQPKVYRYPRWQFTNASSDILGLCCWALDLADIPWRRSNHRVISVSRRAAVARLDELVGLKA